MLDVGRMSLAVNQLQTQQQVESIQQHQLLDKAGEERSVLPVDGAELPAEAGSSREDEAAREQQRHLLQQQVDEQLRSVQPYLGGVVDVRI